MKIVIRRLSYKEAIFDTVFIVLLFQIALQYAENEIISSIFNYVDEVVSLLFLFYIFIRLFKGYKFEYKDKQIFILGIAFFAIGFASSIVNYLQPLNASMVDFFICAKFIVGYFGTRMLWGKDTDTDFIKRNLNGLARKITVVFFVLAVHDELFTPFFEVGDQRFWGYSMQLCYPHPAYLAAACSVLLIVLAVSSNKETNNRNYMIMISCVIFFTFRAKAIAFVAIFWGLYILIVKMRVKSKFIYGVSGAIMAIYLGYEQLQTYYLTEKFSPRAIMLTDAIELAKDAFPLGKGFATFGSHMSVEYYSPLYVLLGYNQVYGMRQENASYLNDGFWQIIIGQFGFVGLILFILLIVQFFLTAFMLKPDKVGYYTYSAVLALNIYLVISSVAETAYFAPFAILYFVVFAMIINQNKKMLN